MISRHRSGAGALFAPALAFLFVAPAHAGETSPSLTDRVREEVIVTGSHVPRAAREVGSAVTLFSDEDIEHRKVTLGSDLLREAPGLAVSRNGPVGNLTQARIRGAEGNHTLVFIDGINANDPALGSEFDFAHLMTWDVGRIEVLRGPQSALYGSDSIGGVISIRTLDPQPGFAAHVQGEGGSFGTTRLGGTLSGGTDAVRGLISAFDYDTDGISASAIQPEEDGYENTTLHARLEADFAEVFTARAVVRHLDNALETDRQDFDFPPTPTQGLVIDANDETESEQLYGLGELEARLLDGRWLHRLAYAYTDTETDNYVEGVLDSGTRGERNQVDYETTLLFANDGLEHALTGAIQHEELEFENIYNPFPGADQRQKDDQTSYIGEYALGFFRTGSLSLSVRHDENDRFEDATTYRATGAYLFDDTGTRVHASYGKGITDPGFLELFGFFPGSYIGNPDLEPEQSDGWDVGLEQALFDGRALVDITYFSADLEDEIITVFLPPTFEGTPVNQDGTSERDGVEILADAQIGDAWSLRGTYTWLDATDPDGEEEVRRPRHSGSVNVNLSFMDGRGNVNLGALYNGNQEDSEFVNATPQTRVNLDSYTLVNLAISFDITGNLQVFARGENLLDEDYTEVFGYRSPGAAGYVGVRARL